MQRPLGKSQLSMAPSIGLLLLPVNSVAGCPRSVGLRYSTEDRCIGLRGPMRLSARLDCRWDTHRRNIPIAVKRCADLTASLPAPFAQVPLRRMTVLIVLNAIEMSNRNDWYLM